MRWPGTEVLENEGLTNGNFITFFRDRAQMEQPRRFRMPSSTSFDLEENQRKMEEYYSSYFKSFALLVQLSDAEGLIFSEVFDLRLLDEQEEGDVIEGKLPAPVELRRHVAMHQPTLFISLTIIRRDDCKFICLCSGSGGLRAVDVFIQRGHP